MRRGEAALSRRQVPTRPVRASRCGRPSMPGGSKAERQRKALAALAQRVGAMVLARAVDDIRFSDEIPAATKAELVGGYGVPQTQG
jgi:hypothetical protein